MFKRVINYLRTLFRIKAEAAMDPEVEIEQAIDEARKQDRQLRNQAAKVIAHREQLETKIEKSADQVGEAREMAKQALLRAERAKAEEDAAGVEKCILIAAAATARHSSQIQAKLAHNYLSLAELLSGRLTRKFKSALLYAVSVFYCN